MRRKSQSPASGPDEFSDEPPDDMLDDAHVEAITPISSSSDQPDHSAAEGPPAAPGWTKRLTTRGKVARALVIALVVTAALVALLPHPTITLSPDVARLLTPAPTQTPLPGRFSSGEWEPVARPPVQTAYFYDLVPSTADPNTAYACHFIESGGHSRVVQLWLTRDAGYTWRQAELPTVTGSNCAVAPAFDGSHRVTMSVDNLALDQNTRPCAHSQYLLSEDDGMTWRLIRHTSIMPESTDSGGCQLWATSRHLFLYSVSYSDQGVEFLERSDDGGLIWLPVDRELAASNADWYPQLLDASGDTLGALVGTTPDLWISRDAGTRWQRIGPIARDVGGIAIVISDLVTEANVSHAPRTCRCAFASSSLGFLGARGGRQIFVSHDYTHWTPLPPLPVKGTSASRSGVYQVLGLTADGRLLALGAEPDTGIVATPDQSGDVNGPPPRLWAWNTQTARWELAETRIVLGSMDKYAIATYSPGRS